MAELKVAKEWNFRPSEFGICPPDLDLAYMLAFDKAVSEMTAYEEQEQERKLEAKRRQGNK